MPCAFVEVKEGARATEAEIIEHCRARLAHFKAPKREQVKSASAIDT